MAALCTVFRKPRLRLSAQTRQGTQSDARRVTGRMRSALRRRHKDLDVADLSREGHLGDRLHDALGCGRHRDLDFQLRRKITEFGAAGISVCALLRPEPVTR